MFRPCDNAHIWLFSSSAHLNSAESRVPREDVKYLEEGFTKLQKDKTCKSLLKKHLTKQVFEKLKFRQTKTFRSNLRDVIQSGMLHWAGLIKVATPSRWNKTKHRVDTPQTQSI